MQTLPTILQPYYTGKKVNFHIKFPKEHYHLSDNHTDYYDIHSLNHEKLVKVMSMFDNLEVVYNEWVGNYFLASRDEDVVDDEKLLLLVGLLDDCFIRESEPATKNRTVNYTLMNEVEVEVKIEDCKPCNYCVHGRGFYEPEECQDCIIMGSKFKPKTK